jgi:hypothetical protein
MGIFIGLDPMKVFHHYDSPVTRGVLMNDRLFKCRFLNSTEQEYDSFIFGSSRSNAFKTHNWANHIHSNNIYHLGVNDESIFGLYGKLFYLDKHGFKIKNALIILDHRLLSLTKNHSAHIFREPPIISGESKIEFYKRFFFAFINPKFLYNYSEYIFTGKINKASKVLWDPGFIFNYYTGDIFYKQMDCLIELDSVKYYEDKTQVFYKRDYTDNYAPKIVISEKAEQTLVKIEEIFNKQNTNYRVIITPNYDQKKLHNDDFLLLQNIFGKGNVYDYSGVNNITNEIGNYYEERHFKPYIANRLLKDVY